MKTLSEVKDELPGRDLRARWDEAGRDLSHFALQDVQRVSILPSNNNVRREKPFGHVAGSFRQKVRKYSVNAPRMRDP